MNGLLQAFQKDLEKRNAARLEWVTLKNDVLRCKKEYAEKLAALQHLADLAKMRVDEWDLKIEVAESIKRRNHNPPETHRHD